MSLRSEVHMKLYVKYLHNRLKTKAELPETKQSSEAEPQETQLYRLVPASPVHFHYLYRGLDEQSNVH